MEYAWHGVLPDAHSRFMKIQDDSFFAELTPVFLGVVFVVFCGHFCPLDRRADLLSRSALRIFTMNFLTTHGFGELDRSF